jgi:hypothetical protein
MSLPRAQFIRQQIINEYFMLRKAKLQNQCQIYTLVTTNLNYTPDERGSSSFVRTVIREFLREKRAGESPRNLSNK